MAQNSDRPTPQKPDRDTPGSDELSQRLDSLKARLGEPKKAEPAKKHSASSSNRAGIAQAFKLSSEFVAGVLVGGAMGYAIDTFVGTSPWGLIIFVLLGFCAAILNVLRASGMVAESALRVHKDAEAEKTSGSSSDSNRGTTGDDR
ncbi:MAG: AtpZ/AtpI family protein [Ahrensia sp.]|nr:AtpZ/AtpI family protein [Ahrensia sp.]